MGLLRGWLIRGLLVGLLVALGVAGWIVHTWVSPEQVREALLATLHERFPKAEVEVGSARMRIFGGISVTDLRITRRGDARSFLDTHSAIIFHDKEQLNHGRLLIRKIEIDQPTIHLQRNATGEWNFTDLKPVKRDDDPVPTIVLRQATIHIADEQSEAMPPITIKQANLSLLNDPITVLKFDVQGTLVAGSGEKPFELPFSAFVVREQESGTVKAHVAVEKLRIEPRLAPVLAKLHPNLGDLLLDFDAEVGFKADVQFLPGDCQPLRYDVRLKVRNGTYSDDRLPDPITELTASVRVKDGQVIVTEGNARMGASGIRFDLTSRTKPTVLPKEYPSSRPPFAVVRSEFVDSSLSMVCHGEEDKLDEVAANDPFPLEELEDELQSIHLRISELHLDDRFFDKLPEKSLDIQKTYQPKGSLDLDYEFVRSETSWQRAITANPNQMSMAYEAFPYPVENVTGSIKHLMKPGQRDEFRIQINGLAGKQRVELLGRVVGTGDHPMIDLKLAGNDFPLNDSVADYLPERFGTGLRKLRVTAQADFVVDIRQDQGAVCCDNTFRIRLYDGKLNPSNAPYPLDDVKGRVLISMTHAAGQPDKPQTHVELRDFQARHKTGLYEMSGESDPTPDMPGRKVALRVKGTDCPLDDALEEALRALELGNLWDELSPSGSLGFGATIEWIDRETESNEAVVHADGRPEQNEPSTVTMATMAQPGEPDFDAENDLMVKFDFHGPTFTPAAFPYRLDQVQGELLYKKGTIDLYHVGANHGDTQLSLDAARLLLNPTGGFFAELGKFDVTTLRNDVALQNALPESLRTTLQELNARGDLNVHMKHMIFKQSAAPRPDPISATQTVQYQSPSLAIHQAPATIVYWNGEIAFQNFAADIGMNLRDAHGRIATVGLHQGDHLGKIVGNVWFDRATLADHPVTNIKSAFLIREQLTDPLDANHYSPAAIEFSKISANLYQGIVGGEARVVFDTPARYRLWLTGTGIQLSELSKTLAKSSKAEVDGLLQGKLVLENRVDPLTSVSTRLGQGQLDIPKGRLYNLPVLLPMLKLLKLQKPDQTAFEEAHALFDIVDDKIIVTQLDLIGNAVSLGGTGELDMDAEHVHFEFFTIWSQALKKWLTTPLGDVTSFLSGNLFKIEMVRENGKMKYTPQMLPAVTGPMQKVAERLRDRLERTRSSVFPQ